MNEDQKPAAEGQEENKPAENTSEAQQAPAEESTEGEKAPAEEGSEQAAS